MYVLNMNKLSIFVGNKAKGRNSTRVFQENKARQILQKPNISYQLIRAHTEKLTHPFDSRKFWINDFFSLKFIHYEKRPI